jgi:hypothetical protein
MQAKYGVRDSSDLPKGNCRTGVIIKQVILQPQTITTLRREQQQQQTTT